MHQQTQDDQIEPTCSSSVQIRGVDLKTCRKQWAIVKGGEKVSGISMLMARHDENDDISSVSSASLHFQRKYFVQTITDANYANVIAFLANKPTQTEFLLLSLQRVTDGIGLHVNADKTENIFFNQRDYISKLKADCLKLVDKVTYPRSSVSSTESDINTRLAKAWAAIYRNAPAKGNAPANAPGPVLDFGPERGPGKGTMADLGPFN